ncbi:hypothetical protein K503DRAFT_769121 [Rhizopogon vinicolor AM-OR11-026]|uniref:Uncharacterized protein n=1 Tax=Rhizopogon vinicolor AM-OR11-026 TaxID=1314800 RepID=A0A1B7N4T3_9AGAM|nr:hypothetical protein K503DRAFT_769121 [Rhizopogon vinicolor AM-OR11-026]
MASEVLIGAQDGCHSVHSQVSTPYYPNFAAYSSTDISSGMRACGLKNRSIMYLQLRMAVRAF